MILKAAYFSLIGHPETCALTWNADLRPAINYEMKQVREAAEWFLANSHIL